MDRVCSGSKCNTCQVSLNSFNGGKVVINFRNEVSDLFYSNFQCFLLESDKSNLAIDTFEYF